MERLNIERLSPEVLQYLEVREKDDHAKEIEDRIKGKPRLCDYHGGEGENILSKRECSVNVSERLRQGRPVK